MLGAFHHAKKTITVFSIGTEKTLLWDRSFTPGPTLAQSRNGASRPSQLAPYPTSMIVSSAVLRKHGDRNPNSRMPHIKHVVSAVDEVDVAVVRVGPSNRPWLGNLKVVTTVSEMRTTSHYFDVTDREVVFATKMSTEMFVCNAAGMLVVSFLIVPFFLASLFFFFISMLVLSNYGEHSCEKNCGTNSAHCCESLHVKTSLRSNQMQAPAALRHKIQVTETRCSGTTECCRQRDSAGNSGRGIVRD